MAKGDDLQLERFAICRGLGLTVEETVSACGLSSNQTYYNRTAKDAARFDALRTFTEARAEQIVAKRVGKISTSVSNEERIGQLFGRALALSERLLSKAEEKGDDITLDELSEIHKTFTQWAAKYAASEAPKRIQVGGQVEHVHVLADETVDRLTKSLEKAERFGLLPPATVVEAEIVA